MKSLAVFVDGNNESEYALKESVLIAKSLKASLTIVHAVKLHHPVGAYSGFIQSALLGTPMLEEDVTNDLNEKIMTMGTNILNHAAEKVKKVDGLGEVTEKLVSCETNEKEASVEFLRQSNFDMVVTGTRQQTPLQRTFLGSFSSYLVNHNISSDILVVKKDRPDFKFE